VTTGPYDAAGPERGLDPAEDPDRFVPDEEPMRSVSPDPARGLDMSKDPDRYDPEVHDVPPTDPSGKSLTELIGKERSFEEERNPYLWLAGLVAVFTFLGLVSLLFANLSPR
jgi:hypothetical protein